ncbi:MAG TPA: 3-dehydroquinate synthase, partial [Bacteroidetes bacterium]|nr:3-dehydroquinate synthase [Bacteroidota bacterium]
MNNIISTSDYPIHIGTNALEALRDLVAAGSFTQVMVLTDHNTARECLPRLKKVLEFDAHFSISPGEKHKTIASCEAVWEAMTTHGLDRKSLLINLGGGLVGDLGGFSAACFKRGLAFVQVPTSLLAQVDASVGGKTGVNFAHFKNQVGTFVNPLAVFVDSTFLDTLPEREALSGYAEVLKHCLIADGLRWVDLAGLSGLPMSLGPVIASSIQIKADIVALDPREDGPRKGLNFGHTVGHALESWFMDQTKSLLHGEAVAMGMICESFISYQLGTL